MPLHYHKKISLQSKSFAILFIIAFLGTYISYVHNKEATVNSTLNSEPSNNYYFQKFKIVQADKTEKNINTSNWKTYSNKKWGLSFRLPENWQVKNTKNIGDFSVFEIDPGKKYYNMYVYASPKSFYAMDGLPTTTEKIAGLDVLNVNDLLYGVKTENYFTFDIGVSLKLKDVFKALVHTVQFSSLQ